MSLEAFIKRAVNNESISFPETIAIINEHYHSQPTLFTNGLDSEKVTSTAGTNEGSCKIFAFASSHNLNAQQTLNLFGDYYHKDVLNNPNGTDHANIRTFMKFGWQGILFADTALTLKV